MLKDSIVEIFKEYNFNILNCYESTEGNRKGFYIHLNECIFFIEEKEKQVSVAFDVATLPDVAAKIVYLLYGIKNVEYISVMENYFVKEGKFFSGEQAMLSFRSYLAEKENKLHEMMNGIKFFSC
jgi:hypothetical protein